MKKLKYLKLFEAFESTKLSKTLGFIDKRSRENFLYQLTNISTNLDFPMSEFSDDLFEYLPFNKALKRNVELIEDKEIPCDNESDWIPGEFCKDGKIKRTWGSHTRMVECPKCGGKGHLLQKASNPIRLIKFWFDKDGKYIITTGSDGKKRQGERPWGKPASQFSKDISDYEKIGELSGREVAKLPTGSVVFAELVRHRDPVICYVVKYNLWGDPRVFLFQDEFSGDRCPVPQDGYDFGKRSWKVMNNSDINKATLLKPKDFEEKENFYLYNSELEIHSYSFKLIDKSIEDRLNKADFAIILDWEKLKSKEFKNVSSFKSERSERKKGALKLRSDESIRKENLERYTNKLIQSYDLDDSLKNIKRIISVGLSSRPLDFISSKKNFGNIEELITQFYNAGIEENEITKKSIKSNITYYLRQIYEQSRISSNYIKDNIKKGEEILQSKKGTETYETMKKSFDIWEKWNELNKKLSDKIKSFEPNSIEELEINWGKILTISNILSSRYRYPNLDKLKGVSSYIIRRDYDLYHELKDYIERSISEEQKYYEELKKLENVIDRL